MIDYSEQDAPIDQLIWRIIDSSPCSADFRDYIKHSSESGLHLDQAIERLIELDSSDSDCTEDERRYPEAIAEIEKLAKDGSSVAQFHMGKILDNGIGVKGDKGCSEGWYRAAIVQGETRSHINQALRLEAQNKAVLWLKRAAVCGDTAAQRILGLTYLWGVDVVRNAHFGFKWLTRAAEGGDTYAAYQFGKFLQKEDPPQLEEAAKWLEQAAKAGDSEAQAIIGTCYWSGRGVAVDPHAAHKWIKLSSLQGDPYGLYLLGRLYYSGIDVPEDFVRAAQCFRKSAERGHAGGQAKLGWCYLQGEGVKLDVAEGMLWLSRAAEQGSGDACATIGYVLRDGIGVERNSVEASKWFLDAAERGDAQGQYELAMHYATGNGLAKDPSEARKWMEKSAAQGHAEAISWLKAASETVVEVLPC